EKVPEKRFRALVSKRRCMPCVLMGEALCCFILKKPRGARKRLRGGRAMASKIVSVDAGSPAARAGVQAGETLLAIDGTAVRDVLDYKFYSYDARLTLKVLEQDGQTVREVRVRKQEGEPLGLNFDHYLMDKMKQCSNKCVFCFIDQLPKGMRKTLYVKDDDARMSFLMGNYISMT